MRSAAQEHDWDWENVSTFTGLSQKPWLLARSSSRDKHGKQYGSILCLCIQCCVERRGQMKGNVSPLLLLTSVFSVLLWQFTSDHKLELGVVWEPMRPHTHTHTRYIREKKAVPGLLAVSTLFANHNANLFFPPWYARSYHTPHQTQAHHKSRTKTGALSLQAAKTFQHKCKLKKNTLNTQKKGKWDVQTHTEEMLQPVTNQVMQAGRRNNMAVQCLALNA